MSATRKNSRGANLVEMALVVPLLLLLLAGVLDLGRAYHTYIVMLNAAREGARYGVDHWADEGGMVARVFSEANANGVDLSGANVTVSQHGPGNPVTVTVHVGFDTLMGTVLGVPSFPIEANAVFLAR